MSQHRLAFAVVAHRIAGLAHGSGERIGTRVGSRPEGFEEFVGGSNALAVLDQVDEQVEDLRLDVNPLPTPLERTRFGVESVIPERKSHDCRDSVSFPRDILPQASHLKTGARHE
jgi:hypothetical protein